MHRRPGFVSGALGRPRPGVGSAGHPRVLALSTLLRSQEANGRFRGTLTDTSGHVVRIDKLWGLITGDAVAGGPDSIWFSAGPDSETHSLLGILTAK